MPTQDPSSQETTTTRAQIILLDIEGTTTSISFVKDELFPYILQNVTSYLESTYEDEQTQTDIEALRVLAASDVKEGVEGCVQVPEASEDKNLIIMETVKNVEWQMSKDIKSTALKQLQGHMWLNAYKQEKVKGHLYGDVTDCIKKWSESKKVCIYSSGSVSAQKLLFKYSVEGDLTKYLTAHFDTKLGQKREAASYIAIAKELEASAQDILFLTDIVQEADAAKEAGMEAMILIRPGNMPLSEDELKKHQIINNFNQIKFSQGEEDEPSMKKAKLSYDKN